MKKSINELRKEIEDLNNRKKELENLLSKALNNVFKDVADTQEIKRLSEKTLVVKASDLMGTPWTPTYHDWLVSAEVLKNHLGKKPMETWKNVLQEMVNTTKSKHSIHLGKNEDVSIDFIKKIIEQL